jgi:hypothetical protein
MFPPYMYLDKQHRQQIMKKNNYCQHKGAIGGRFYTWHVELMRPPPAPQKDSP